MLSHSGGAGIVHDRSVATHSAISPALETIVPMAIDSGRISRSSNAPVMATTASIRLPHSHDCSRRMAGHVATTIIKAQTIAPRKGRRIQIVKRDQGDNDQNAERGAREIRRERGRRACHPSSPRRGTLATSTASSTVVNAMPSNPSSTTSVRAAADTGVMSP